MSKNPPSQPLPDWSFRIEQGAQGTHAGSRASSRTQRVQTLAEWLRSQWVREQMARAVPSSIAEGFGAPVEASHPAKGTAAERASPSPHPSPPQSSSPMP